MPTADLVPVYHLGQTQLLTFWGTEEISRKWRASVGLFWGAYGLPLPRKHQIITLAGAPIPGKTSLHLCQAILSCGAVLGCLWPARARKHKIITLVGAIIPGVLFSNKDLACRSAGQVSECCHCLGETRVSAPGGYTQPGMKICNLKHGSLQTTFCITADLSLIQSLVILWNRCCIVLGK